MPLGILEQQRLVAEGLRLVRRYTSDLWLAYVPALGKIPTQNPGFKTVTWAEVSSNWPTSVA